MCGVPLGFSEDLWKTAMPLENILDISRLPIDRATETGPMVKISGSSGIPMMRKP